MNENWFNNKFNVISPLKKDFNLPSDCELHNGRLPDVAL